MEFNSHYYDLIDNYLQGKLSKKEEDEFNYLLANDPEFAEEVKLQQELISSLSYYSASSNLRKKLDKAHNLYYKKGLVVEGSFNRNLKTILITTSIAASIALAVVMGTLYFAGWFDYNKNVTAYYELRKDIENLSSNQKSIWQELFNNDKKTTLRYSGTGFFISSDGYFVTNYHLIKNSDTVLISNNYDSLIRFPAIVVFKNSKTDIAILKVLADSNYSFGIIPFSTTQDQVYLGDDVYTLGYSKDDIVFGQGSISSLSGFNNDTIAYEISVPANPGNSGAPLFDNKGNLVGIVSGKHSQKEGSTFAIKAKYLQCVLDQMAGDSICSIPVIPSSNSIKWLKKSDQIKKLQPFIYKVEVYQ